MAIRRTRGSGLNDDTKSASLLIASGLPGNPLSVTPTRVDPESMNLSWTAPTITNGTVTGYTVEISPTPTYSPATVNVGSTSTSLTNLNANTSYTFTVRATNSLGTGGRSAGGAQSTLNWNLASGGTEATYNIGPYSYRAHYFTGNSTLSVTRSTGPWEYVAGGGGGGGAANNQGGWGGPGGTGVGSTGTLTSVPVGANPVTIGGGGGGGGGDPGGPGSPGGTTSIGAPTLFTRGGGGGGGANAPQTPSGSQGTPNGPQVTNTYSDGVTSRSYSGGGGAGRTGHPSGGGSPGGAGAIAIRYKTGRISA